MEGRDQSSRGDSPILVHDSLLHVSLDGLQHCSVCNLAEGADGGGSVDVLSASHVLRQTACHDDHVVGQDGQLLDGQVDQTAQSGVLALPQLRDSEERPSGFCAADRLSCKGECLFCGDCFAD